jgi:hypothetical protein
MEVWEKTVMPVFDLSVKSALVYSFGMVVTTLRVISFIFSIDSEGIFQSCLF